MKIVLLAAVLPALAQAQSPLVGHWVGHIRPDRPFMLKAAKSPEHRKLLSYALDRLQASKVSIDLGSNGHFVYKFDDGYAADSGTARGTWSADQTTLILMVPGEHPYTKRIPLQAGGKRFTTNYNDLKGVPIIFQKG